MTKEFEPVEKRHVMHIGYRGYKGINHLIYEMVDNSVDEYMEGFCSTITVTLEKDGSCSVEDDGREIPIDLQRKVILAISLIDNKLQSIGTTNARGTKINFMPDYDIFETLEFKASEIKTRLHERAYLSPNLTINFIDKRQKEVESITYHEPKGLYGFVESLNENNK